MRRRLMCHAAVAVLAIAGAWQPAVANADPSEDYFLNELYKTWQKWYWPFGEQYIITVGRGVCDAWNAGMDYPAEVAALSAEKGWTQRNTRYFVALSTGAFCPERYESAIPAEARPKDAPRGWN